MDFTKSEIEEIRKWIHFNNKITKFQNSANGYMFKHLFDDDWERLLNHFIIDCNRNYNMFRTYLTAHQSDWLLLYIVRISL